MKQEYFICLDEAPVRCIKGSKPKYDLLLGDIQEASGFLVASSKTIKSLLSKVPPNQNIYRVYLKRTDGFSGNKIIRKGFNPLEN